MFGFNKKTRVRIVLTGKEVHELKAVMLRIHSSLEEHKTMPPEVRTVVKHAYAAALQLTDEQMHFLSNEGSILWDFLNSLEDLADYIKNSLHTEMIVRLAEDVEYAASLLRHIVQEAYSQEEEFVKKLGIVVTLASGIINKSKMAAA